MTEFNYTIKDPAGIHARPAGLFVKEAAAFDGTVTIGKNGKDVDAKRILGVMSLGVKSGEQITVKVDGAGEKEVADKLKAFLEANL
ncbi:MAG: HPr family phosphocarrier protein [Lachnospiraceae bacterium]|nr:HPr family phosphocarrier protein [Lachnospiraceae bacterium]MCR5256003.1 HPr family phosphocarrier protein [Acetatifactor sp.]